MALMSLNSSGSACDMTAPYALMVSPDAKAPAWRSMSFNWPIATATAGNHSLSIKASETSLSTHCARSELSRMLSIKSICALLMVFVV